jgi:amino acid adenylation domain-containing protein/non-ribosomal peptide synthase protein (TIGR01720 family)
LSHNPIYQAMLVLQNAPMPPLEMRGVSSQLVQTSGQSSELDLVLSMWEKDGVLEGVANYSTDLFDPETVDRFLGHFRNLLESIVSHPEARVSELGLLSPAEKDQLVSKWNATEADYPRESCVHALIESQAERTPEAQAVVFGEQVLTYSQLNQRANQLAHRLRALGVGPETLVGLCVERSLEMIVGILGILKAGGAYVPMDPAYPEERLAFMLEDTSTPVLVVQEHLLQNVPAREARIVHMKPGGEGLFRESIANPPALARPENLAYVMYTSGSTGKPKGVQITHRNLVHCITAYMTRYHKPMNRFLLLFSYAFDGSVPGIFGTLTQGGMLVLPKEGDQMDVGQLSALIRRHKITHTICLASLYGVLLGEIKPEYLASLEFVMLGGEACPPELARRHCKLLPDTILSNAYGPTEASVWCTEHTCRPEDRGAIVPIGTPIANTEAHVLDANRQLLPIGVAGELYIGGEGLSRGYLNREELTAERFIANPLSAKPGARLYRTGDLVRRLPDGSLEFLGRIDHQVKIRGFRIELGEIETRLRAHPGVRDALVIAREPSSTGAASPGGKHLVAYLLAETPATGEPLPSPADLRAWVKRNLPDYMIPAFFVMLDAFPAMPSGKIDLRALPAPDASSRAGLSAESAGPATPAQETLARIWSEVLGLDHVGLHDNFFELGGDSIISIQIIHRANQAGLQLAPRLIFQHQTITELAAAAGVSQRVHAEQGPVGGSLPLTPIQRWFFDQDLTGVHHWNQAMVLETPSAADPATLENALRHLVKQHDALRMRFKRAGSASPGEASLEWAQFNAASDDEAGKLIRFDLSALPEEKRKQALENAAGELQGSLNLSEGPLMRAALFDFGKSRPSLLVLIVHHLVVDFVSWRIVLEDLETACEQLSRGQSIQLPRKTTSFRHWAHRLTEHAQHAETRKELGFWLGQPWSRVSPLPVDLSEGENTAESARIVTEYLSAGETHALLQEAPKIYHTQINDVLLMALARAFTRWTGKETLLVELEGHGREDIIPDAGLSRTAGWFTAVFPVPLNLEGAPGPAEAIKAVKEQLRRIPNRGIGFGILRYLTQDPAIHSRLGSLPEPQMCFNYLGQFGQSASSSPGRFGITWESAGPLRHPGGRRLYLLEVDSMVADGQLRVDWTYSANRHERKTMENVARWFMEELRSFLFHCGSPEAGGFTPSDFPEANLSQEELDDIMSQLGESGAPETDA